MSQMYDTDLDRNAANHVPLSPISFLTRTARAYPEKLAVIHGDIRRNWGEVYERSVRLASALSKPLVEVYLEVKPIETSRPFVGCKHCLQASSILPPTPKAKSGKISFLLPYTSPYLTSP